MKEKDREHHHQQFLSTEERWFLLGSLSYAFMKLEGNNMAQAGYPEDEITAYIIEHLDQIMTDFFGQPLTTDDLEKIAHVMESTDKVLRSAFQPKW